MWEECGNSTNKSAANTNMSDHTCMHTLYIYCIYCIYCGTGTQHNKHTAGHHMCLLTPIWVLLHHSDKLFYNLNFLLSLQGTDIHKLTNKHYLSKVLVKWITTNRHYDGSNSSKLQKQGIQELTMILQVNIHPIHTRGNKR